MKIAVFLKCLLAVSLATQVKEMNAKNEFRYVANTSISLHRYLH
jgi:hypothetical protein